MERRIEIKIKGIFRKNLDNRQFGVDSLFELERIMNECYLINEALMIDYAKNQIGFLKLKM